MSHSFSCVGAKGQGEWRAGETGEGQGEAPGAGHLKGESCAGSRAGRLVRGQLASSVRGRWNSAGTSGREQRKSWGGGAKRGTEGGGKARGGWPGPCCVNSQL